MLLLLGCACICTGYYLPWYSIVFAPPAGYIIANGQEIYGFTYATSGLNAGVNTTTQLLYPLILTTFLLGLFNLARATLSPEAANQVIQKIGGFFHSKITGGIADCLHALVHIMIALAWLAFLFLYIGLLSSEGPKLFASRLESGDFANQIYHYVSIHMGIGMLSMFAGLLISGITLLRYVAATVVLIILAWIITAVFHLSYFGELLHLLGY